jgi:hypothetical protein
VKIATQSIDTQSDRVDLAIARAFIAAYIHAMRMIPMPCLVGIEKRVHGFDLSFVLTFESAQIEVKSYREGVLL